MRIILEFSCFVVAVCMLFLCVKISWGKLFRILFIDAGP